MTEHGRFFVRLLGGWGLTEVDREPITVRRPIARLVAYLAVRGRSHERTVVSGTLWPDVCDHRAASNLRSTLWHARTEVAGLIDGDGTHVGLGDGVDLDIDVATFTARALLAGESPVGQPVEALLEDVLPGWQEEWLTVPRFLHRQLRLQALDKAIATELDADRVGSALRLAQVVTGREPWRESSRRLLASCPAV